MTPGGAPRLLRGLGVLLVLYLAYPVGAFVYRVIGGHGEGWNDPGLWSALWVSVVGATISVLIGVVAGIQVMVTVQASANGGAGSLSSFHKAYFVGALAALAAVVCGFFVRDTPRGLRTAPIEVTAH